MPPPATIGPYRVLHQLGAGALGPVFRAHDADGDRLVAIKLFRLDLTPEQAATLATALDDVCRRLPETPTLVPALAAGVEGAMAWLALTYVPADALDARLRRRAAGGLRHAVPILDQIASAIDAAADVGISHGALHPRDVLVTTTGETYVTGFGVISAIEAVGGRVSPRRPYSSPERADGGAPSRAGDVFSLGALAFELLTGRRLVGLGAAAAGLVSGASEGADADACRAALARALAESPDNRFKTAAEFVRALEASLDKDARDAVAVAKTRPTSQPRLLDDEPPLGVAPASPVAPVGDEELLSPTPAAFDVEADVETAAPKVKTPRFPKRSVRKPAEAIVPTVAPDFDVDDLPMHSAGPAADPSDVPLQVAGHGEDVDVASLRPPDPLPLDHEALDLQAPGARTLDDEDEVIELSPAPVAPERVMEIDHSPDIPEEVEVWPPTPVQPEPPPAEPRAASVAQVTETAEDVPSVDEVLAGPDATDLGLSPEAIGPAVEASEAPAVMEEVTPFEEQEPDIGEVAKDEVAEEEDERRRVQARRGRRLRSPSADRYWCGVRSPPLC